jgi:hypothetical protein
MRVAAPWSLSHYIPQSTFNPLYRALFEHAPDGIRISAYDNVRLQRALSSDLPLRACVTELTRRVEDEVARAATGSVAKSYGEAFFPANRALTQLLPGDVEFHHSAAFVGGNRPFVLHCESLCSLLTSLDLTPTGYDGGLAAVRDFYRTIFEGKSCLSIHSNLQHTLDCFSNFFRSDVIDQKLAKSKIGVAELSYSASPVMSDWASGQVFLFAGSEDLADQSFETDGGYIVLRFWREFISSGRRGRLLMRCGRPDDDLLHQHDVAPDFIRQQLGKTIFWHENECSSQEMAHLFSVSDFLLLPGTALHSAAILHALASGTVPVVSDVLGADNYIDTGRDGIVLRGTGENADARYDGNECFQRRRPHSPIASKVLMQQMCEEIFPLADNPERLKSMAEASLATHRSRFSATEFAAGFWQDVARACGGVSPHFERADRSQIDVEKALVGPVEWTRHFEGAKRPKKLVNTGRDLVMEYGAAFVRAPSHHQFDLHDWCVMANHLRPETRPNLAFAPSLADLTASLFAQPLVVAGVPATLSDVEQPYLTSDPAVTSAVPNVGSPASVKQFWLKLWVSEALREYPRAYRNASRIYRVLARFKRFTVNYIRYFKSTLGADRNIMDENIELIADCIGTYRVVKYFHVYYAYPAEFGEFSDRIMRIRGEDGVLSSYSAERLFRRIRLISKSSTEHIAERKAEVAADNARGTTS